MPPILWMKPQSRLQKRHHLRPSIIPAPIIERSKARVMGIRTFPPVSTSCGFWCRRHFRPAVPWSCTLVIGLRWRSVYSVLTKFVCVVLASFGRVVEHVIGNLDILKAFGRFVALFMTHFIRMRCQGYPVICLLYRF